MITEIPQEIREEIGRKFVDYVRNLLETDVHFVYEKEFMEEIEKILKDKGFSIVSTRNQIVLEIEKTPELLQEIHALFNIPNFINSYPQVSFNLFKPIRLAEIMKEEK